MLHPVCKQTKPPLPDTCCILRNGINMVPRLGARDSQQVAELSLEPTYAWPPGSAPTYFGGMTLDPTSMASRDEGHKNCSNLSSGSQKTWKPGTTGPSSHSECPLWPSLSEQSCAFPVYLSLCCSVPYISLTPCTCQVSSESKGLSCIDSLISARLLSL